MQYQVIYENGWGFRIHLRFDSRTAAEVWAARLRARGYVDVIVEPCADWIWQ